MTTPKVLSVDPGEPAGLALWRRTDGALLWSEQADFPRLYGLLESLKRANITDVVYEDFRLRASRAMQQTGSRFEASQAIGMLKLFAFQVKANLHVQGGNILPVAEALRGEKMPKDHKISHVVSARLHGHYWLTNQGILESRLKLDDPLV